MDRGGQIRPEGQDAAWAQVLHVIRAIASEARHGYSPGPKVKEPHGVQIEMAKDLGNAAGADDRTARDRVRVITAPAPILKHSALAEPAATRGRPLR